MRLIYQCQMCLAEFSNEDKCKEHELTCENNYYLKYIYCKNNEGITENNILKYIKTIQGDNEFNINLVDYKNLKRYIELTKEKEAQRECSPNSN